jgi:hypothetical protein
VVVTKDKSSSQMLVQNERGSEETKRKNSVIGKELNESVVSFVVNFICVKM